MIEKVRYMVWPLFWLPDGQPSVPDSVLWGVWAQMTNEGKAASVFYGGTITTGEAFIAFMRSPQIHACLVADQEKQKLVFLAWLTDYDGTPVGHFCSLGKYRHGAAEAVLAYWKKLGVKTVVGITPELNLMALKLIDHLGFRVLSGPIPGICCMSDGSRMGAVISYREL